MGNRTVLTALLVACLASTVFAAPPQAQQIELLASDSPYSLLEALKLRLNAAEVKLATPQPLPRDVQMVISENPELLAAMSNEGWERAYFKGIGDVQIKQAQNRSLIKIPAAKTSDGLLVVAMAMKAMVRCGGGDVCISLDSASLATKQKSGEGR